MSSRGTISKECIPYLYHMTHLENVAIIAASGLKSHNLAHRRHKPVDISDPDVQDRRQNRKDPLYPRPLQDYVALYFRARNPTRYARRNQQHRVAVLYVDSNVLLDEGTIFTDGNAASHQTRSFSNIVDLKHLDWACLRADYWHEHDDGKRKRCAEVLVPNEVTTDCICRVVVLNQSAQDEIKDSVQWLIEVKPRYFF